jgi:succinate-semialdehyde dehydrogenase/glutarate-semialdehyde dehydrogenase
MEVMRDETLGPGSAEPREASGMGQGYGPGLLDEVTATKVVHLSPAPPR